MWIDADDDSWYEFFVNVRKLEGEKEATKDCDPPLVFLERCNSGNFVEKLPGRRQRNLSHHYIMKMNNLEN